MLVPTLLTEALLATWLPEDGHPPAATVSGQRFAQAVSAWFATATAGPFPCATALARSGQLGASAGSALQAGTAPAAGAMLATALVSYLTGQVFGPGTAGAPLAAPVAQVGLAAVFADLDADREDRAAQVTTAVYTLALSTVVVFPPVVSPPVPVM